MQNFFSVASYLNDQLLSALDRSIMSISAPGELHIGLFQQSRIRRYKFLV